MSNLLSKNSFSRIEIADQKIFEESNKIIKEAQLGLNLPTTRQWLGEIAQGSLTGAPFGIPGVIGGALWGSINKPIELAFYNSKTNQQKASWQIGIAMEKIQKVANDLKEKLAAVYSLNPDQPRFFDKFQYDLTNTLSYLAKSLKEYVDINVEKKINVKASSRFKIDSQSNCDAENSVRTAQLSNVVKKILPRAKALVPAATVGVIDWALQPAQKIFDSFEATRAAVVKLSDLKSDLIPIFQEVERLLAKDSNKNTVKSLTDNILSYIDSMMQDAQAYDNQVKKEWQRREKENQEFEKYRREQNRNRRLERPWTNSQYNIDGTKKEE